MTDMQSTRSGWTSGHADGLFSWATPFPGGNFLTMGETASFTFRTAVVPVGEAQGMGTPAPIGVGDEAPHGVLPGGMVATAQVKAPGVTLEATVKTVTFGLAKDNQNRPVGTMLSILADPGDAPFEGKHWVDTEPDRKINSKGDQALPVGYVRKSGVAVIAEFVVTEGAPANRIIYVRADGPGNYDLGWTAANIGADNIARIGPANLKSNLADKVDHIPDFALEWQVSLTKPAAGKTGRNAGITTNEMFVTLAAPKLKPAVGTGANAQPAEELYVTPLWLFCKGAKGATSDKIAVPGAWGSFGSRQVKTHESLDPLRKAKDPSEPLYYYREWNTPHLYAKQLLQFKDGQCNSWVSLLGLTFRAGGVTKSMSTYRIEALKGDQITNFVVENWDFKAQQTSTLPGYSHANVIANPEEGSFEIAILGGLILNNAGTWKYNWGPNPEVTDEPGLKGQNDTEPPSIFRKHFVGIMDLGDGKSRLFDPSYGNEYTAAVGGEVGQQQARKNWEAASLAGYATRAKAGTDADGKSIYKMNFAKPGSQDFRVRLEPN